MFDCNPVGTAMDGNQKLTAAMSHTNELEQRERQKFYTCKLSDVYLLQRRLHDLTLVSQLMFSVNPGKAHWTAVKRVIKGFLK